jgi:hypothetical protein
MSAYSAAVQLRSPELGSLDGKLLSAGEGFEILVSSPSAQHCSLHLQFFSESSFSLSGMLMLPELSLSFIARETGEWEKVALGKVVSLPSRK